MDKQLLVKQANQIALVTGASSGIGQALCRELVNQHYTVIGIARSLNKLDDLKQELGNLFTYQVCDVSQKASIEAVSHQLLEQNLCPTVFFLNAGLAGEQAVENPHKFEAAIHEKIMAVNYLGVLNWIDKWEKPCLQNGGAHFIVTGSVNAFFAPKGGSAYAASKAAISKAFEGLAATYFGTDLTFSVVYAGPVATTGLKGNLPFIWSPEKMAKYMIRCAKKKKQHCEPSLFYSFLTRLLRWSPNKWKARLFKEG